MNGPYLFLNYRAKWRKSEAVLQYIPCYNPPLVGGTLLALKVFFEVHPVQDCSACYTSD
ncbi:MAG TPA: hypothetical protein VGZ26_08060 [Pirellulales bacterium]|nr:hypothetical protein [Pirellulales bacterium]